MVQHRMLRHLKVRCLHSVPVFFRIFQKFYLNKFQNTPISFLTNQVHVTLIFHRGKTFYSTRKINTKQLKQSRALSKNILFRRYIHLHIQKSIHLDTFFEYFLNMAKRWTFINHRKMHMYIHLFCIRKRFPSTYFLWSRYNRTELTFIVFTYLMFE